MSTTRRRVAILLAGTLVLMFGPQRAGSSKAKRISRRPERWHAGSTSLSQPRARPVTKAQRRGRGFVQCPPPSTADVSSCYEHLYQRPCKKPAYNTRKRTERPGRTNIF